MTTRRGFLASLAAGAAACTGATGMAGPEGPPGPPGPPAPPPPPPPAPGSTAKLSDFGVTWIGDETDKVLTAIDSVSRFGGTLDLEGRHLVTTAAPAIGATDQLIGQQRGLRIVNCDLGWTVRGRQPFRAKPGVQVLFFEMNRVLLEMPDLVAGDRMWDYTWFSKALWDHCWIRPLPGVTAFWGIGNGAGSGPYQMKWIGNEIGAGGNGIEAVALSGPSSGPNDLTIRDNRFNQVATAVKIGRHCQQAHFDGQNLFETFDTALDLGGVSTYVGPDHRFEGGNRGIILRRFSHGMIDTQYWSSIPSECRIIAEGDQVDLARWAIAFQPEQG